MSQSNQHFMDRLKTDPEFAAEIERNEAQAEDPGPSYVDRISHAANMGYALLLVRSVADRLEKKQGNEVRALRMAIDILEKSQGTLSINDSIPF